jgi:hypothetical protein
LLLFHAAWWLMLICYSLAVAEFMSGHLGLLASLYVVSSSAFSGAFASGLALRRKIGYPLLPGPRSARRTVVVLFLSLGGSMLVLWNAYMYGPPPLLRLFGATTEVYTEYGRLKAVLFALRNPLNNVPTYLGWVWMDFGWLGIVLLNVIWGFAGGMLVERAPGRGGLASLPYYASVATLFFNDHFLWFPTLVQMGAAYGIERWVWRGEKA